MSTYVIGDIQGCFDELQALLSVINFQEGKDVLWFTGDLVNRGPKSLEVLRFIYRLPNVICVLGNHDLSLLALAYTGKAIRHHTLESILQAADKEELLEWLRHRPLLHQDTVFPYVLVHAGISPQWTIEKAKQCASEVETLLRGPHFKDLLNTMFGNTPNRWDEQLTGWERYRFIINSLTRLRFCDTFGNLDLTYKGPLYSAPKNLTPWFKVSAGKHHNTNILFGHWAALEGYTDEENIIPLDTGCVWGGSLTALRLEDKKKFALVCTDYGSMNS
jgi:bis(5'-nucleosyl)-tetraphosphatase (symmetrical)